MITKSCGVEWIGDIPQEWEISRIKYVSDFQPTCDTSMLTNESIVTYTPMEYIKNGYYIKNDSPYGKLSSSLTQYCEGDIVMAKVTPCFENGNIAIMTNLSSGIGMGSSELFVFRAKRINVKYLFYWLRNTGFVNAACATMTGTGGLKRVSPYFVYNSVICYPKKNEYQQRIVEFLDRKCAEIDSIITKTKATIEHYKALKQSVITQAVTKGIRPDRPMKDSGIEWIGEIPQEWNCNITKRFCTFKTGSTPSTANQEWFDGELNWFTPSDFNESYYLSKSSRALSVKAKQDNVATIIPNNTVMIIGIGGTAGKIGLTMCECSCNQQITALINSPRLLSKYLMYWMIANTKYLKETALFTTLPIINNQTIGSYPIIVPSDLSEQQEIADYLDRKCAEIDRLIAAKEQLLTELESYKKSVIYEYVTGKKEV